MALDRMAGAFEPLARPRLDLRPVAIDLAGRPSLAWAGAVIDCLDLAAGTRPSQPPELVLRRCRWPLFLLPLAARRARCGTGLRLRWRYGEGTITCIADSAGRCRAVLEGAPIDLGQVVRSSGPVEVRVTGRGSAVRGAERVRRTQVIDAETLDAALRRTLTAGIQVEDALWSRIAAVAQRVLVPASEESRERGAGGGDAND
jgi:hypothetical protein